MRTQVKSLVLLTWMVCMPMIGVTTNAHGNEPGRSVDGLLPNGVHPNNNGHELVAKRLLCSGSFAGKNEPQILESQSPAAVRPKDPVIVRADVVFQAGMGLLPGVVRLANGELIAWWSASGGDGQPGQSTQLARSKDSGKTWSKPHLTIKPEQPLTGSYSTLSLMPDGRLLCYTVEIVWPGEPNMPSSDPKFSELAGNRKFDNYYSFSDDGGRTFTKRKPMGHSVNRTDFAQGNFAQLRGGDLIWPWGYWHPTPLNGFRRSTDGGQTWQPLVGAWRDPPPGHKTPVGFNETGVTACKDGTIVAVARVDTFVDKRFWLIKSSDNGKTWTSPRTIEMAGGSPVLYCTPQGQLWLAFRDAGIGNGLGLAVSDDNGDRWRFLFHLKEPLIERKVGLYTAEDRRQPWRPSEGFTGYPCFARLSDDQVYVVFHVRNLKEEAKTLDTPYPYYIAGNLLRIPR